MIRGVQKARSVYNQEQLAMKSIADHEKQQNEKDENINEEMKKLIDQEHQWLSKQKSLQDEQNNAKLLLGEGRPQENKSDNGSDRIR